MTQFELAKKTTKPLDGIRLIAEYMLQKEGRAAMAGTIVTN